MSSEPNGSRLHAHADVTKTSSPQQTVRNCERAKQQSRPSMSSNGQDHCPGLIASFLRLERVTVICIEPQMLEAFHDARYDNNGLRHDDRDGSLSPRDLRLRCA